MDINSTCFKESSLPYGAGAYCPPIYDNVMCWPATLANTTAYMNCTGTTAIAHRLCFSNGTWERLTNYTACYNTTTKTTLDPLFQTLVMIMFVGSVISDIVLVISLVIFHSFISQQCQRTIIHKNLIVSFILRFTIIAIFLEPVVFRHEFWYLRQVWLYRVLITIEKLSYLANFFWMLLEGLYLHVILVLRPLNNDNIPSLFFYIFGWVIPLAIAATWATILHYVHDFPFWNFHTKLPYIYIIYAPIMLALFINLLIMMNLVRLIIVKVCTGQASEQQKICRTIKSTLVLVFLLGIINLVFMTNGDGGEHTTMIYRYVNAVVPNCQGIVVAVIYCGMNSEVRRAISNRWSRFKVNRNMQSSFYRCRSSRASMSTFVARTNQSHDHEGNFMELKALKESEVNGHSTRDAATTTTQNTEVRMEIRDITGSSLTE